MTNANMARQVVFELFQELDRFNLGDYQKFNDQGRGMQRLVGFVARTAKLFQSNFRREDDTKWSLVSNGEAPLYFTTDRERALQDESLQLLGLEHPVISKMMSLYSELESGLRSIVGKVEGLPGGGLLTIWKINTQAKDGQASHHIVRIGMTKDGDRAPWLERLEDRILNMAPAASVPMEEWQRLALEKKRRMQDLLHRELTYSGIVNEERSYSALPLAIIGVES